MLVQLKYLLGTVIFTKFKIKKSLLCCLEKFASQNANFLQFIISVLYIFFYKDFHNNNLSSIIIIICFPVWPVHTLY